MSKLRLLIHAPTEAALARARSNARNLATIAPETEIEIVVNAAGVAAALAKGDPATDRLLVFCANSLRNQSLDAPGVRVVDAAVLHIALRQAEGWGYMRA